MTPLIIAHRGDSSRRPENTLASFSLALEIGAPIIELDVRLTRDGQLVVIHDASVDRTTDARGEVAEMTLAEIREISAGYPERFGTAYPELRVPTLDEALALLQDHARVLIELKTHASDPGGAALVAATIETIARRRTESQTALISFDGDALAESRQRMPQVPRGLLVHSGQAPEALRAAAALGCTLLLPEKRLVQASWVTAAREIGIDLATWVVDEVADYEMAAGLGLVGVGTNRPSLLLDHQRALAGAEKLRRETPSPR